MYENVCAQKDRVLELECFLLGDLNSDVSKKKNSHPYIRLQNIFYIFVTGFRLSNNRLELHLLVAQYQM